jgi:prepilin-type N-terminal cleavage/methylation domain-containing protein
MMTAARSVITRISGFWEEAGKMKLPAFFLKSVKGFTVVELAVVIVIMGILVGFAAPNYQAQIARYRAYSAAREMVGEIRAVQQKAIAEEEASYNILFDVANECYYVRKGDTTLKTVTVENGVVYSTNFLYNGTLNKLGFSATGRPLSRGGTVTLQNKYGEIYYVIVAVHSGRVRIDKTVPPDPNPEIGT